MNRLNLMIEYWYSVAEAASHPLTLDRDKFKIAVKENHDFCDIAEAIRKGYKVVR